MFTRPRLPQSRPQPTRVAQPVRGAAWSITDEAVDRIDQSIAVHRPEHGGALIATRDGRIVVDFLPDPRPGEQVSYWHSPQLADALGAHLQSHPKRRYGGTLHSHPGRYAEPSGPDHEAFATQLATNPTVREALFPIVVQARRRDLCGVLRLGERHLMDLPHGTLAAYSVVPNDETVDVRPAPIHVIPLRRDVDHACDVLADRLGRSITASPTQEMEIEGRYLPSVSMSVDGEPLCTLIFPAEYPSQPPVVVSRHDGARAPAWQIGPDSASQLADALTTVALRARAAASGESLEDRLAHHLPGGMSARYLVIGAGSVGSNAAELLVRSGVRQLTVVDFDTVEIPNLSRTTYDRADVGASKVSALARRLSEISPEVRLTAIDARIQDLDVALLADIDVTVLASDDLGVEFWLAHHLYHRGIAMVSIKMFERGEAGEVVTVVPSAGTACLRCIIGEPGGDRGETDYGTGRLEAAPGLGVDIVATVARGVRIALALGQRSGPLAEWIAPLITLSRTYFQHASVPDHDRLTALRSGRPSPAFDAAWYRTASSDGCAVCGTDRCEPDATFDTRVPDLPPPGVVANTPSPRRLHPTRS